MTADCTAQRREVILRSSARFSASILKVMITVCCFNLGIGADTAGIPDCSVMAATVSSMGSQGSTVQNPKEHCFGLARMARSVRFCGLFRHRLLMGKLRPRD